MKATDTLERKILAGPQCTQCGGPTRIVRIEPHRRFRRRHVWTLECLECAVEQAVDMPAPRSTH